MDIRTLSHDEKCQLRRDLQDAIVGGRDFRISADSYGVKWKVGQGMWTPSMGTNENAEPNDGENSCGHSHYARRLSSRGW